MAKIFEQESDLIREEKTIKHFVSIFNGQYQKLDRFDVDYLVYDKDMKEIAYVEIKGRNKNIRDAYPLPIAIRKLNKLADKKLNPVIIWSCFDGIIYGRLEQIEGFIKWGGCRQQREGAVNDIELMAYYNKQNNLKEIYIENFRNQ